MTGHPAQPAARTLPDFTRYWCPREPGSYMVDGDGYLVPPLGAAALFQSALTTLDALESARCIVLLGESGLGKSHELRRHYAPQGARGRAVWLEDLSQHGSVSELRQSLDSNEAIAGWIGGTGDFTLALDSFDEALISLKTLAAGLPSVLRRLPLERLRMRVACRTSEWPEVLGVELGGLWADASAEVYELVPLSREDVRAAAVVWGLDPDAFLAAVQLHGLQPLASKPTTLEFLLSAYDPRHGFPASAADLYLAGCRRLCEETDEERRASRRAGELSAEDRLAVASRMAAATLFGNRAAIWTGSLASTPATDVSVSEVASGEEPVGVRRVPVTEDAIRETISTGLFSGRGPWRMGWVHQSYGEFLAARWVTVRALTLPQIAGLIRHPDDAGRAIIPQLHGTAAWLAEMRTDVQALVIGLDPTILLFSDALVSSDRLRHATVEGILAQVEQGTLLPPDHQVARLYPKLQHSGLQDQLRLVLQDRSLSEATREVAISIAGKCKASGLAPLLVDIARDATTSVRLRVRAALAVAEAGTNEDRAGLVPLAAEPHAEDEADELKGAALRAIWPDQLGPELLFAALTPAKRSNHYGLYSEFMGRVAGKVDESLLVPGLKWMRTFRNSRPELRDHLENSIMVAAWKHLESPGVLELFAEEVWYRVQHHEEIVDGEALERFAGDVAGDAQKRRMVIAALVGHAAAEGSRLSYISVARPRLVADEDFLWLVERACETTENEGLQYAHLVGQFRVWGNPAQLEHLWQVREHPNLREFARSRFGPILLDSPEAERGRELAALHARAAGAQEDEESPVDLTTDPLDTLLALDGNEIADRWTRIMHEFAVERDGRRSRRGFVDVVARPLWEVSAAPLRTQVVDLAEKFLRSSDPEASGWFSSDRDAMTNGAFAGYRAFRLLQSEAGARLLALPEEVWTRWAGVLVGMPRYASDTELGTPHDALTALADARARGALLTAVGSQCRVEAAAHQQLLHLDRLDSIWSRDLEQVLLSLLEPGVLPSRAAGGVLTSLLAHECGQARQLVAQAAARIEGEGALDDRALVASRALAQVSAKEWWTVFSPIVLASRDLARNLVLDIAGHSETLGAQLARDLGDVDFGNFVSRLMDLFPFPDPHHTGVYSPTGDDTARGWRLQGLNVLESRGAVSALEMVAREHTEYPWLRETVLRAAAVAREKTWRAPSPANVFALADQRSRRLVQGTAQLQEVVLESLARLQAELQGELPSVEDLWDSHSRRPKDEGYLADRVARHFRADLEGRGIVANCEVVIARGGDGGRPGQRTDIYVDAVVEPTAGELGTVSVIFEVKGSWHDEVLTAMETQLCDYLATNQRTRYGVYLVGWFLCDRWNAEDGRHAKTKRHGSLGALKAKLEQQAIDLGRPDRVLGVVVLDAAWR